MTISQTALNKKNEEYLFRNSMGNNDDTEFVFQSAYRFDEPYMQISKLQAKTLQGVIKCNNIHKILEVGTFVGYSGISFLKVLPEGGEVNTIEINNDFFTQAVKNLSQYNSLYKPKAIMNILFGDAKLVIPKHIQLIKDSDMIFLDGDKLNYTFYVKLFQQHMKVGAFLIIDNTLFKGNVAKARQNEYAAAIDKAIIYLKECNTFSFYFVPIGDCMLIARKGEL